MFNNLLRLTAATFIWKKYKSRIVSTVGLILYFWLIASIHADYLSYREIEGSGDNLGLSFFLKWAAWLAGIAVYFLYDHLVDRGKKNHSKSSAIPGRGNSATSDQFGSFEKGKKNNELQGNNEQSDPFEEIRTKTSLRSKADIVIDKANKKEP